MNGRATRRDATRVLVVAAPLIALAWMLAPAPSPPLYDGFQVPAEPYRYLAPPPGAQQTQPPTSASKPLTVSDGTVPAAFVATGEQPPQAQLLVGDGTLLAPAGAHTVTLAIKPVPPPAPLPASIGRLAGNVYQVTASADSGGEATLKSGATPPTVVLRGPTGSNAAQIARMPEGGSWARLQTVPLGSGAPDTVAANTPGLGFFAVVVPPGGSSSGNGGGGGGSGGGSFPAVAVVVPLAAVLLLAGVLVAIRLSRGGADGGPTSSRGGPRGRR